jgi:hypothetical protein
MKYLLKTEAEFAVNRDDTFMYLYDENVAVKHGYALVEKVTSKDALLPRSFNVVTELSDDDNRTLDELIEAYRPQPEEN